MSPFHVTIEHRNGAVLVRPSGELDVMTAPKLEQALAGVLGKHKDVLVDLSGVVFADCAGLRPIRRAVERGSGNPMTVRILGTPPRVERVLRLTGFRRTPPFGDS
jgi:anti-sigma B factor antagonist